MTGRGGDDPAAVSEPGDGVAPRREPKGDELKTAATDETDPVSGGLSTAQVRQQERSVGRNSSLMAMGTLGSRVLGVIRNALAVAVIGANTKAADAFNTANTLPTQIYVLIDSGLLTAVLIPAITKALKNRDGGKDFVNRLLTVCLLGLVVVTAVATVAAPWLIRLLAKTTDPAALQLTILLGYICMPQILFYGIYAVLGQVLNVQNRYGAFAVAPALANVVQIVGLTVFLVLWGYQPVPGQWSATMTWVLAGSYTLGIAVQGLSVAVALKRSGFEFRPALGLRGYGFGSVSRLAGWTFGAVGVSQLGLLFATRLFWTLGEGTDGGPVTVYNQAFTTFMLPHSLFTVSIITAMYPALAATWQERDTEGIRRQLRSGMSLPAVGVIPASVAMVVLSQPLVHTLLPTADPEAVAAIALSMSIMCVGLLPTGINYLRQRYFYTLEDGRSNFLCQITLTGLNVTFGLGAFLLAPIWAVPMWAAGQSLANWAVAGLFVLIARRDLGGLGMAPVVGLWARLLLASGIGGLAAWPASRLVLGHASGWLGSVLALLAGVTGFLLVFFVAARFARITEVGDLVGGILRKLHLKR